MRHGLPTLLPVVLLLVACQEQTPHVPVYVTVANPTFSDENIIAHGSKDSLKVLVFRDESPGLRVSRERTHGAIDQDDPDAWRYLMPIHVLIVNGTTRHLNLAPGRFEHRARDRSLVSLYGGPAQQLFSQAGVRESAYASVPPHQSGRFTMMVGREAWDGSWTYRDAWADTEAIVVTGYFQHERVEIIAEKAREL